MPTRCRPPSPNVSIARRHGAASTPRPAGSSSVTAPRGSDSWPASSFPAPSKSSTSTTPGSICATWPRPSTALGTDLADRRAAGTGGPSWTPAGSAPSSPRCASMSRPRPKRESAFTTCSGNRSRMRYSQFRAKGLCNLFGRRRGRVQADRRTTQARRHALDRRRRQRHHRPAVLRPQRTLRGLLGATSRNRMTPHLTMMSVHSVGNSCGSFRATTFPGQACLIPLGRQEGASATARNPAAAGRGPRGRRAPQPRIKQAHGSKPSWSASSSTGMASTPGSRRERRGRAGRGTTLHGPRARPGARCARSELVPGKLQTSGQVPPRMGSRMSDDRKAAPISRLFSTTCKDGVVDQTGVEPVTS